MAGVGGNVSNDNSDITCGSMVITVCTICKHPKIIQYLKGGHTIPHCPCEHKKPQPSKITPAYLKSLRGDKIIGDDEVAEVAEVAETGDDAEEMEENE